MKKIKILRIITRLNIGGPAIHASLLTKELNNDGFESMLMHGALSKDEGDMGYASDLSFGKPVYVPSLKREINFLSEFGALLRIFMFIKKYRPDVVHTHTAKAGALGRIAAILARVPAKVHTFHGNVFHGYFAEARTNFFIRIERFLAKFTDAIIAISQRQESDISKKYRISPPEKCRIIRLGFDLGSFLNSESKRNAFRKELKCADDDILIGIAGRFVPIKNHKMFIDAARHMMKIAPEGIKRRAKFVIIGDGALKSELLAYSRFVRIAEKVFLTGWVRDMAAAYAGLDIVALTSINEGTPVSLIEAMASKRPVISTDVGGVKDAVGEAGILVKSGDYMAMGERMLELASSPQKRESLGNCGREWASANYSKNRLVSELSELYRKLLLKKKGR